MSGQVWLSDRPGPQESYETGVVTYWHDPKDLFDRRDFMMHKHQEHKRRIRLIRNIINGEWEREWPGLNAEPMMPAVANHLEQAYRHWSATFGAQTPQITVPVPTGRGIPGGKKSARKRERRLKELWDKCELEHMAAKLGGDLVATGSALAMCWVDFDIPNPADREPYILRIDPLHSYPMKDSKDQITELLITRRRDIPTWLREHPEYQKRFHRTKKADIEEQYWYWPDKFMYVVADVSAAGKRAANAWQVWTVENKLGYIPAYEAVWATVDGQRRGMLDQALGPLYYAQLLMSRAIEQANQSVFPIRVAYGVHNADKVGPGGIIYTQDKDGRVETLETKSTFDIRSNVVQVMDSIRQQVAFPQQLQGEPGASIVSAQGTRSVQGQIDVQLAWGHKRLERLFTSMSEHMLAMDECYCPGERTIYGNTSEKRSGESYNAAKDVNGNRKASVSYGMGAGSDPSQRELRLATAVQNGAISRQTYQDLLGYVEDPDLETMKAARQQLFDALMLRTSQQIQAGEVNPQTEETVKLIQEPDATIEEIIDKLIVSVQESQVPAMTGQQGLEPPRDALELGENIARGGQGEPEGPPTQLPQLQRMMGDNYPSQTI